MAKKKLQSFSADDASDVFTPTVKTFTSAEAPPPSGSSESITSPVAVPIVEKPSDSRAERPSAPTVQPESAAAEKSEKVAPPIPPTKPVPQSVETGEKPPVKTVNPEPVAPPKPAPVAVKASGNAPVSMPPAKSESKPAVPRKTPSNQSASAGAPQGKQAESKEKTKAAAQTHIELVGFILGKEEFAIEINKVQDINRMVEITRVPKAPDFVEGVMNLRGKVLPVIHLRKRFNLPEKPFDRSSRIIVVEVAGSIMGFIVDAITEVLRVPSHFIEPAPDLVGGIDSEYIMGVGKLQNRLLILIDLGKVLTKKMS
jgi:purine-binding chemotaxis protein CheW